MNELSVKIRFLIQRLGFTRVLVELGTSKIRIMNFLERGDALPIKVPSRVEKLFKEHAFRKIVEEVEEKANS